MSRYFPSLYRDVNKKKTKNTHTQKKNSNDSKIVEEDK